MSNGFHELFFRNFFKLATAFVIAAGFLYVLSPFIIAFFFGGMLALALSPFVAKFMKEYSWSKKKALNVVSAALFFLIAVPFGIFFMRGARIISEFFTKQSLSTLTQTTQESVYKFIDQLAVSNHLESEMVKEKFNTFITTAGTLIFKTFSDMVTQIPDLLLGVLVMNLSFYFFLLKEDEIREIFDRYYYFSKDHSNRFINVLKSSCREVFLSNVITGILQSTIISLGALACGLGDFYIVFFLTFIISFIPVIGAAPMAFALAIIAFVEKRTGAGIAMAIIGTFAGVADNLVRPYLVSLGEVEVPAFIGFLAVIGGVYVLGLPGLFVGPLLASLVYGALPIIVEEYFPPKENKIIESLDENA
nr:AI-2E family transporter [Bacteriovorax sp. HI3]